MDTDQPAVTPPGDPAREWFWTGVPAGFIFSIVGLVVWAVLGLWPSVVLVVALVAATAWLPCRDGTHCLTRYVAGVAVLLVPAAVVYTVFIRAVLGR